MSKVVRIGYIILAIMGVMPADPLFAETAPYTPITVAPAAEQRTVILNGHDLTVDDVIAVARDGAKVRFSPEAITEGQAKWDLLAQAGAQEMPVYGVTRGAGAEREVSVSTEKRQLALATLNRAGARAGALPEIAEEELVRAFLVIQANHLPYNASPSGYMQAICDLLNQRVTPVMYSRGTLGEGDLHITSNFHATLLGRGDAYFRGKRMAARDALAQAGLRPYQGEMGKATSNAYSTALAVLLVTDGRRALEWADLTLAMDLLALNSSITPLAPPVQARRPFPWVNWEAAKLLDLLRGSYLMEKDDKRVLQDPESLRASYIRLGSAWQAWKDLDDAVTLQMNSGEQNPAVIVDAKPEDSWVLSSPWMMGYYVKGGALSHGRSGYVISNANWDPYPMTNEVEAFNLAFANMAVTVANRIERFNDRGPTAFFTGIKPADVLTPEQIARSPYESESFFTYLDIWKELQMLTQSVPPDSSGSDLGVADLEAVTRLKASRGRQAVDLFMQLAGYDLLVSSYWLDVRKAQDPKRDFGPAATAAWTEVRKALPWQQDSDSRVDLPYGVIAYDFMTAHPATGFLGAGPHMPATLPLPVAK